MNKIISLGLILSLVACSSDLNIQNSVEDIQQVNTLANKKVTLSMNKKSSGIEKKIDPMYKFPDKKSSNVKKEVLPLNITFTKVDIPKKNSSWLKPLPYAPGYFKDDETQIPIAARKALTLMNESSSFEESYDIGRLTLQSMSRDGVYIADLGTGAALASRNWQNGFKFLVVVLQHIAESRPTTSQKACEVLEIIMNSSSSWEDAYSAASAGLRIVKSKEDDYAVKRIIENGLKESEESQTYAEAVRALKNTCQYLIKSKALSSTVK
jgi:hypothetical protein